MCTVYVCTVTCACVYSERNRPEVCRRRSDEAVKVIIGTVAMNRVDKHDDEEKKRKKQVGAMAQQHVQRQKIYEILLKKKYI